MPITSSAKKALRSSLRKRVFNARRKIAMKEAIKDARKLGPSKGADSPAALSKAYQAIDKALKRGVIKANTAARKKSRLTILLNKSKAKAA
jgi:small subunit ribosomal protein S20